MVSKLLEYMETVTVVPKNLRHFLWYLADPIVKDSKDVVDFK